MTNIVTQTYTGPLTQCTRGAAYCKIDMRLVR